MEQKPKSFFARWLKGTMQPDLSTEEKQKTESKDSKTLAQHLPQTILVLTSEQEHVFSAAQKAEFEQYLKLAGPVTIGEINFVPFEVGQHLGGYYLRAFIRHARDLEEEFTLGPTPLSLIDDVGDIVARGVFRPQTFGTLRFGEARVWTFAWREDEIIKKDPDFTSFTIRFE